MKRKSYIHILSAVALIALAGCTDDDFVKEQTAAGNGIVFAATAGYSGPVTKTEYGEDSNDGNSQEINWVNNDQVEIYSPQSNPNQADYTVTKTDPDSNGEYTEEPSTATLSATNGLTWGSETTQDFYAIYPAVSSIKNEDVRKLVSFKNGTLTGYIPVNQQHEISYNGTWTAKPNMDYLYMAAIEKGYQVPSFDDYTNGSQGVSLDFVPLTTTLEVTLTGTADSEKTPIVQLNVTDNTGGDIAGAFTCDLVNGQLDEENYPICTPVETSTARYMITVSTYYRVGETRQPMTLKNGESITFNIFLLPHQELENLSLRVVGLNTTGKQMELTNVKLEAHKKTRVKVNAPTFSTGDPNNWISALNDNIYISQLSIPGTANSFSYKYEGDYTAPQAWYAAQLADFETQWNSGIRCFELKCPEPPANSNITNLGEMELQCNRTNVGIKFKDAVEMIWNKVKEETANGKKEFAMIIPAYESNSGHGGDNSAVKRFAEALNTFYNSTSYEYITYGRNITVGEARGKLMFVARITSEEDENALDNDSYKFYPAQGVVIEGWGSLKDLWNRRGYNAPNWAKNDNTFSTTMEYSILNGQFTMPNKGDRKFFHATRRADNSSSSAGAYVQDWNRVSENGKSYRLYGYGNNAQYAYWPESFTEKCNDVWDTFEKAIDDNSDQQGDAFYINSLDGFFIDEDIDLSYKPYIEGRTDTYYSYSYGNGGTAGNIERFAQRINNYFYNAILDYGENNIYGPMNVVLLDRVYQEDNPSKYLPSVIINNNFRFPLLMKDTE